MGHAILRDFDLDAQVGEWRRWQERTSSLSPRQLDELEDHLRARVDLEMELNAALGPAEALRVATHEFGTGAELSKEFAKAGQARWRRLFLMGWAMYTVSFLLPSAEMGFDHGYQFVLEVTLRDLLSLQVVSFMILPNLAMLMTIPVLVGGQPPSGRSLKWFLGFAGIGAIGSAVVGSIPGILPVRADFFAMIIRFGASYWTWAASLTLVAAALHLRARRWASAKPETLARAWGQGAIG